ncbi:GNAT family N-acetyltransferase [Sedimentitalea sp. HM32M-2]|uniref:GNAT family N-acetyltransferase n=1 Tax=Sedimentitalea sp. HM32M-2 TaxID=3351566 RepID=UPI0036D28B1E
MTMPGYAIPARLAGHFQRRFDDFWDRSGRFWRQLRARACRIEALKPADTDRIIAHFAELSPADRAARFNSATSPKVIADRYRNLDWSRTRVLGAISGNRLVAVAEIAETDAAGQAGREVALSVLDGWQGAQIGERLLRSAIQAVCEVEGLPLVMFARGDNSRMINLARKLGAEGTMCNGEYQAEFAPC